MKKLFLLLLLIIGVKPAFADCSSRGMYFYPETKEISLNSLFIIEGYASSQKTIDSFKERIVFLESDNGELIELKLQEILKGEMYLTQAIFCPNSELKPNTTYYLKYSDQTELESKAMNKWNSDKKMSEKVSWKTTDKKFANPFNSDLTISFDKTQVDHYGCGPAAYAIFNIKNKYESEVWYKTEVVEVISGRKTVYYLKAWEGKLNVGHGMCSGAFKLNKSGKYKVRFTPMKIDGKSLKTTNWKTFESPYLNDKGLLGN